MPNRIWDIGLTYDVSHPYSVILVKYYLKSLKILLFVHERNWRDAYHRSIVYLSTVLEFSLPLRTCKLFRLHIAYLTVNISGHEARIFCYPRVPYIKFFRQ